MKIFSSTFCLVILFQSLSKARSWGNQPLPYSGIPVEKKDVSEFSLPKPVSSRQEFWEDVKNIAVGTCVGLFGLPSGSAGAAPLKKVPQYIQERGSLEGGLGPCPGQPVRKSCWSSEDTENRRVVRWEPPTGIKGNSKAIAKELEEIMALYPQEGQNDVDRGGWEQAARETDKNAQATYLRYEFTSGRFKYIDELELLVDASGKVSVRTASRSAGFDYNVNSTRLNYIQKMLKKKGWAVTMV